MSPSLSSQDRAIVEALGGRWSPRGGMCRCPAHEDRTPSLSVRPGDRRLLFHCFAGCQTAHVLAALRRDGWRAFGAESGAKIIDPAPATRTLSRALWQETRPIADSLADHYLAGRGLARRSPALRFLPRTPYDPRPVTRYAPALIAAVHDNDGLTGVHRTFLDPDGAGLALLAILRRALGRLGRGAVRLARAGPVLGLAEGVETALAAMELFGLPCWATLGVERFGRVAIPAHVERLILFLDHDAGGRRAEALARTAFAHRVPVQARYPEQAGEDWNDVLRRQPPTSGP